MQCRHNTPGRLRLLRVNAGHEEDSNDCILSHTGHGLIYSKYRA